MCAYNDWLNATSILWIVANGTRIYGKAMTRTVIEMRNNNSDNRYTLMVNSIQQCCTRVWFFLTSARVYNVHVCSRLNHNNCCRRCKSYVFQVKCTTKCHKCPLGICWLSLAGNNTNFLVCFYFSTTRTFSLTLIILFRHCVCLKTTGFAL